MERISYWLQIIVDCMLNNNLSIDKATFFTVIIGQITIYGILLTFYQFVASYQGGEKAATRYLGINITEYFVKKKIKIFNKIISKKMFGVLLILEILYKPFMTIYGDTLGASTISIINFVWFSFAIGYFILFVVLFIQCTKSILMIKMSSDVKRNGCNSVQREHNKKLNNGLPILHKVPPKRDYGRYFCIMAEKGGTSHGGLTEKLSLFFHAKKQEVNAYGR